MKIINVLHNDWTIEQVKILSKYNITVEPGFGRIDIEEGELYDRMKIFFDKWGVKGSVGTIYNKKDIHSSNMLVYVGSWINGYPQPEDVRSYLESTYNLENYCTVCGIGAIQKNSFRIQKAPTWRVKRTFELNWVLDEIFVHKEIYDKIFKNIGIESLPVILYKKETIIEDVVQLKIPTISGNELQLKDQPFQICINCGQKKYHPQIKGYFPSFKKAISDSMHIFKSEEFFGDQLEAHNKIFISKEFYNTLIAVKINPTVWPVAKR